LESQPLEIFFYYEFQKFNWQACKAGHMTDFYPQYCIVGVDTTSLPMPTSSSDDVAAVTSDLYLMVAIEVKAATSVGPAAEAQHIIGVTKVDMRQ
jgi:hypothetical protein